MEFKKHDVVWTDEKIKNFWNYFVTNEGLLELSFGREAGPGILHIIRPYLKPQGNNLDYGCGSGSLMEYFFKEGIPCAGLDSSPSSLKTVQERFNGNPLFLGVILAHKPPHDIPAESYDFVVCIETIEHLFWERLPEVFREMRRILKQGGYVFITTPFNERLDKQQVICPDCGAVFHRVQHMNRFTVESLSALMENAGFSTIDCNHTLFQRWSGWYEYLKYLIKAILMPFTGKKVFAPHLYYLGFKKT